MECHEVRSVANALTTEGKNRTVVGPFFSFSFSKCYARCSLYNYSLLSSARKREQELKKDETGYLATDKKFSSAFECKIQV